MIYTSNCVSNLIDGVNFRAARYFSPLLFCSGVVLLLPACKMKEVNAVFSLFRQLDSRISKQAFLINSRSNLLLLSNNLLFVRMNAPALIRLFCFFDFKQNNRFAFFGFLVSGNMCSSAFFTQQLLPVANRLAFKSHAFFRLLCFLNTSVILTSNANTTSTIRLLTHSQSKN